ncbi:MAG: hypothetical protein ACKV22_14240 [Bryobacteraceae bacterium]
MTRATAVLLAAAVAQAQPRPTDVRQLFLDERSITSKEGVSLKLHSPIPREIVLTADKPWEGQTLAYVTVLKDGDRYRMYYRASGPPIGSPPKAARGDKAQMDWSYTALAESRDGLHWTKPELGVVQFRGSAKNNLVWPAKGEDSTDLIPFLDTRPGVPADQRYKTLANPNNYELLALASPDGIHWARMQANPVISYVAGDPLMDPQNLAFWDERQQLYVAYLRGWYNTRIRSVRRATSKDFLHWTQPEFVGFGGSDIEHLYINNTFAYDRAPGTYLMFAKRFVPWRKWDLAWPYPGLSEIALLSSRDGIHFDRTFMEPFVSPGLDPKNWHERALMMARGVLHTSPVEMSLYLLEHYRTDAVHIRRMSLRPDGFISVNAPYKGGEFATLPFVWKGRALALNHATSVIGSIRVEIQDAAGRPIPGYRLEECDEIYGDEVSRAVTWRRGHNEIMTADRKESLYPASEIGFALRGQLVRLRFVMKAADLYSFHIN